MRIGLGYDIHRLVAGRKLIIGSVHVPFAKGLLGHSDADVVLHAVCDAVLGAAGLPDIGEQFPDTDPRYKGADSSGLLKQAVKLAAKKGFVVSQVDCVVLAQKPKLSAYKAPMAAAIARLLGVKPDRVSVKAKTTEGLGHIGAGKAISCYVVALLEKGRR